jgi:hypothetical protein
MYMNIQKVNLEDLLATYYHGTAAYEAAKHLGNLIRGDQQRQLATLLRDYRERAITSPKEIKLRAATDRLMTCYSIMEITSLMDFIPALQQTSFGINMRTILENKLVRRYYEEFYPEKMPQLFRRRLAGTNRVIEKIDPPDLNHTIMVFLDLDRRFMETLDDGYLLRMLDSFTIQGYRFSDVVELVSKPDKFINHLLLVPKESDVMSRTINEFSLFMQFCFDLRKLLSQTESYPLIQSAMWNHYSYWFDIIGDELSKQLGEALSRFLEWKPVGEDRDAAKAVQDYVHEAHTVLHVLMSQKFVGPVDVLLKKTMGDNE